MRQPSRVANRYAAALFQTAQKLGAADAVESDLKELGEFFQQYPQVLESLAVPRVPDERKKAALRDLVGSRMNPVTQRFLDLMVDHSREDALPDAAIAYAHLADASRNIVRAEVRSAIALDESQTSRLKAKLDAQTGKDVRLAVTIDPSLLGGLVVRVGDTILDGSVRGYLGLFETQLRNAPLAAIKLEEIRVA